MSISGILGAGPGRAALSKYTPLERLRRLNALSSAFASVGSDGLLGLRPFQRYFKLYPVSQHLGCIQDLDADQLACGIEIGVHAWGYGHRGGRFLARRAEPQVDQIPCRSY